MSERAALSGGSCRRAAGCLSHAGHQGSTDEGARVIGRPQARRSLGGVLPARGGQSRLVPFGGPSAKHNRIALFDGVVARIGRGGIERDLGGSGRRGGRTRGTEEAD